MDIKNSFFILLLLLFCIKEIYHSFKFIIYVNVIIIQTYNISYIRVIIIIFKEKIIYTLKMLLYNKLFGQQFFFTTIITIKVQKGTVI